MNEKVPLRVELIRRSMSCFVLGFFGMIPLLGLPIAALVLARNWQIKRLAQGDWNPAANYLHWGCWLAVAGAALSLFASVVIGMMISISQVGS